MSNKNKQSRQRLSRGWKSTVKALCIVMPGLLVNTPTVFADGTEILEPTSEVLADGTRFIGAGVGLSLGQPGDIEITIPAGASVEQVLIYWDGADRNFGESAPVIGVTEDTIQVDGNDVVGKFIGGRTFNPATQLFTFRADITSLGLVSPGANLLSVEGLDFGTESVETGAGVLVIVDEGMSSPLALFDGNDYAYHACTEDGNCSVTVLRTFAFPASDSARDGDLTMFFTSVAGEASGGDLRPSLVEIAVDGEPPIEIVNQLNSVDGEEWDTVNVQFEVPAGAERVDVQAFSEDPELTGDDPASFKWLTAALSVSDRPGGEGCTPGYWKQEHHFADWTAPYAPDDLFATYFEDAFADRTLLEVLKKGGGGLDALGRHTVAALLNSASGEVSYDLTPQEVIDAFNAVYPGSKGDYESLKNEFEEFNEQGCPLNNSDGSNNGDSSSNAPTVTFTTEATIPPVSMDNQTGGGGMFGAWEILALLAIGWRARRRTVRHS
ncbi:MAG: hypothetical protein GTN98_13435 [Woeseiaceae bacterium]|nr:hypothetical protein [Woeseiaceae bacterium]